MIKNTILFILLFVGISSFAQQKSIDSLFEKDSITIVISDSGLGGLSVVAAIEKNMRDAGYFAKMNIIFVNALFNENGGYNALSDRTEKIDIFNRVLYGIYNNYNPDIIMIACNTLSTILKETHFAKTIRIPTIGIVDIGVNEINTELKKTSNSKVLIFGTETTIEEDSYGAELIRLGIKNERIISQACPQLQKYIETNPEGEDTEMLIMSYVDEALEKTNPNDDIYVSLNCTHYGYSTNLWREAFRFSEHNPLSIINPNIQMSEIFLNHKYANRFKTTVINITVVSKVKINNESIKSISKIIKKESAYASQALINYQIVFDLF